MRDRNLFVRWAGVAALALVLAGAPGNALAKKNVVAGKVNGPFRGWPRGTACVFQRYPGTGVGIFNVASTSKPKVNIRRRSTSYKVVQFAGGVADFTEPGATFPVEVTDDEMAFVDLKNVGIGTDPSTIPGWFAEQGESFTIQITGYKNGRITGKFFGTLQPADTNPNGPIEVNGTFSLTCTIG